MPLIKGHLIAESPIYRGNGLKTLFSRKNKEARTPIELPGRPESRDTGKKLMDAFLGFTNQTKDRTEYVGKLFDDLYKRLFDDRNNEAFFKNIKIDCSFNDPRKKEDCFYDLRMGIRLNRDRMSMEENANYKIETVFKGTNFNFSLDYPNTFDNTQKGKLYLLLKELIDGRFWFGAGKTKGLGKIRLCLDENSSREFEKLNTVEPPIKNTANAMEIRVSFRLSNPLLVGWQFHDEGKDDSQKENKGYHRKIAGWVDQEIQNRQAHLKIKREIASGHIRNFDQIRDEGFKREHQRNGRPFPLDKNNFGKAVANDENLNHFLGWYRSKVLTEIEKPDNCDFRSSKNNPQVARSQTPYDRIFMRMLGWKYSNGTRTNDTGWEAYIPGGTIKGAFRIRAEKIMRTLLNQPLNNGEPTDIGIIGDVFGKQRSAGKIIFSDAYLTREKNYCSVDSIQINPKTGQPIDKAKMDFLYAYGKDFEFTTSFYLQDIKDDQSSGLFFHLLQDMQNGQIPLGGQKTSGMGWVKGEITSIDIKTGQNGTILRLIPDFGKETKAGSWIVKQGTMEQLKKTALYKKAMDSFRTSLPNAGNPAPANSMFKCSENRKEISHAVFSGYSGSLSCHLTVLTPLHIKESGQPTIDMAPASQGWDFFHMGPPDNQNKPEAREYAIPSKTLKGMIRNNYLLLSDKAKAESLFGFLDGNKGYMGRLNFSFAPLCEGAMSWYGMPHHYSDLLEKVYPKNGGGKRDYDRYNDVRIFRHFDFFNSSIVKKYPANQIPSEHDPKITPCRCAEKGSVFSFDVGFWNLRLEELKGLISSILLEETLAHKTGKGKFLGFGSCKINVDFNQSTVYVINQNTNHWREKYSNPTFQPMTFQAFFKEDYPKAVIPGKLKSLLEFK